ncbi:shikimate kinase [Spirulina sp. CCNP1310]|nr:shikimate kinase [Spirulina sp. CCNP1310]
MSVFLVGLMGTGKSTVGKALAQSLQYRFFDSDRLVETVAGQSIADIFTEAGEPAFRELESQVLEQLCAYTQSVIATGGGIVLAPKNWSYLQQGLVVWLDTPVAVIAQRLAAVEDATRPLLNPVDRLSQLTALYNERRDRYAQADLHIQPGPEDAPEAIAHTIIQQIPTVLKTPKTPRVSDP